MPEFNPNEYGLFNRAQINEIRRQWAKVEVPDKQLMGQLRLMIEKQAVSADALQQLINENIPQLSRILQRYKDTGQLKA